MSLPESYIKPVVQLLAQTQSPFDVPADPDIFTGSWLESALLHVVSLLDAADAETSAGVSSTGAGLTHLFLAADPADDYSLQVRLAGEGTAEPRDPEEKTVVLTLSGTMELEAFRHAADVDDDTPWYVRQFAPENIYACHPGTIHSVAQSEDAVQLVISRNGTPVTGRPLTADEYRAAAKSTRAILAHAVETHRAKALAQAPSRT